MPEQFSIEVKKLKLLNEGLSNSVYLVNNNLIFKFPKREKAVSLIAREIDVLIELQEKLALKVPKPKYLGKSSKTFSWPFYGYKLIYGHSGCSIKLTTNEYEQLAISLGRFLKNLHQIKPKDLGLKNNFEPTFDRTDKNRIFKYFEAQVSHINKYYNFNHYYNKFDNIKINALKYQTNNLTTLIHGDLYHRHLLFDDNNILMGVIDWGECYFGDPVADLGVIFQFLPKAHHETFFAEYGYTDKSSLDYAKFLGLYYAIALLCYGHDRSDQDLIRTSLWTVNEL